MLAEVGERALDELGGGSRADHLAAVTRSRDPGREVHVVSDVAFVGQKRGPGVQAHTHLDGVGGESRC